MFVSAQIFSCPVFYGTPCNSALEKLAHFFKKDKLGCHKMVLQYVTMVGYGLEEIVHKRTYKIQ
jgi:hypothetical protein